MILMHWTHTTGAMAIGARTSLMVGSAEIVRVVELVPIVMIVVPQPRTVRTQRGRQSSRYYRQPEVIAHCTTCGIR